MLVLIKLFLLSYYFKSICTVNLELQIKELIHPPRVIWPNATIPFYIETQHFDHEQSLAIMTALSLFASKTCLKFVPVMERPKDRHVMTFINPDGHKRCKISNTGHSALGPHTVHLGYKCLISPNMDMMIMRELGFPFEHNRHDRDDHIQIIFEDIELSALSLYTIDAPLTSPLMGLEYDINSVMHFGQWDNSKNGHQTIKFKKPHLNNKQKRVGLTPTDLLKIERLYGPECIVRDRREKLQQCQTYPGVSRRKRNVETPTTSKSLRVNPNITPPPLIVEDKADNADTKADNQYEIFINLKKLGVEEVAQEILDQIHNVSSKALKNAREKYCNTTKTYQPLPLDRLKEKNTSDILSILEHITEYADNMVTNAMTDMTKFCQKPDSIAAYQRACNWRFDNRCAPTYKSTNAGHIRYSTNHRPYIVQSTNHDGMGHKYSFDKLSWRARNDSDESTTPQIQNRRKRETWNEKTAHSKGNNEGLKNSKKSGRYFPNKQYGFNKQPNSSDKDTSASKVSGEVNDKSLSLEAADIKEPIRDGKLIGVGMRHKTKYFDASSKEAIVHEKSLNNMAKSDIDEDTTVNQEKNDLKNKYKIQANKIKMKEKKTVKAQVLEKAIKESMEQNEGANIEVPKTVKLTKLNREFYNERRWPEGIIRYVIAPLEEYDLEDMRSRIAEVADILKTKTCVRLKEVSEEEAKNYEDYLVLDTSPDYVTGRVGGRQHFGCIDLFKGGQHRQHTAMMVMAMLGFYFEISRHDRDSYIRIHMRHVRPDKLHHFEKIRDEATLDLPYDFESATHPAWQFWRKIGKTGISTVATYKNQDPDGTIMRSLGQHNKLFSDSDIIKINSIYGVECFTDPEETMAA